MTPKILLACTGRWLTTARLALAFRQSGCSVEAVCPAGHPIAQAGAASKIYTYRAFAAFRSMQAAIDAAQPDLICPCDDLAAWLLHSLYVRARRAGDEGDKTCRLIEKSLGDPAGF